MANSASSISSVKEKLTVLWYLVVLFGIVGWLIWICVPISVEYPILYALEYNTDSSRVHYEREPVDCDWGHAPIGDKDCHYERHVSPKYAGDGTVTDVFVTWEKLPN